MFLLTYSLSVGQKKATHQQIMAVKGEFFLHLLPILLPISKKDLQPKP